MVEETIKVICKNCASEKVIRWGSYKGVQRYYCKACKRKFKADDAPFHMKVSPSHISSALSMYYTGSSITDIRNHIRQETGYYPSKSVVFEWINKYTEQAVRQFRNCHPKVGDKWIADETMLDLDRGVKVWFWDIIDADTRFLLATRVSLTRTATDAKRLIQDAVKKAGKAPKTIITDYQKAYPDGVFTALGGATEHLPSKPFTIASESTNIVERFHETVKERTKVMKAFRDIETLLPFVDGFLVYYNYLKPHEGLNGKTPAEQAKLRYSTKTWVDVVNAPVLKRVEVSAHISPKMMLPQTRTSLAGAFKRHRITPRPPRISGQSVFPLGGISRKHRRRRGRIIY